MKEIVNKVLAHPFATSFIIGAASCGIADIIRAIKGNYVPRVKITCSDKPKTE